MLVVPRGYEDWLRWIYSFYVPQERYPKVRASRAFARSVLGAEFVARQDILQVTGTNGKGSTATWAEELLLQRKESMVCLTSPHIYTVRERIRVDGNILGKRSFCEVLRELYPYIIRLQASGFSPSPFQILSWMAFFLQKQAGKPCAGIYEVGAGGGTDSTNIFSRGVVALTKVTDDHLHDFGGTLEAVALEKLRLCTRGKILYFQPQSREISSIIGRRSKRKGFAAHEVRTTSGTADFSVLPRSWQIANFLLAQASIGTEGKLSREATSRVNSRLPCRLGTHLIASTVFTVDVAHNLDAIDHLLEVVSVTSEMHVAALIGLSRNAKWMECLRKVVHSDLFADILAVRYSRARPADPEAMAAMYPGRVTPHRSFVRAVDAILEGPSQRCFVFGHPSVCGDFYRALCLLGHPSLVPEEEFDPIQPWMNDSW
jgi:folylpolyglutamate synthase/dihydrofolate synthase